MSAAVSHHAPGSAGPAAAPPKHPWWALTALLIGLSMIIVDGSIVGVLLPSMVGDLKLSDTDVLWVNSIYSLIFASLLITVGLLSDKYGRRLLFLTGGTVFLIGSVLAGLSEAAPHLIAARAVQAVGAAMMLPSSIAVINVMFSGRQRAIAFGMWGAVFGGAAAIGPLLGGWMAQDFSWRWGFFINIPIGIVAAVGVVLTVPESRVPSISGFDPLGVLLSASGLALIVFGLIEGQEYGWWRAITDFELGPLTLGRGQISPVIWCFVIGAILLIGLIFWERNRTRRGKTALVNLSLFAIRRYGFGNVVALVVSLGEFGILFVLPLWIQSVGGFSPLGSGAVLAFLALGTIVAGGSARRVSQSMGATQVVRLGMVLEVAGVVGIGFALSTSWSPWWITIPLVVYGVGLGFDSAQLTNVVLADIPPETSGEASAMTSTFRQIGSALGSAVLGAVLFTGLGTLVTHSITTDPGVLTPAQQQQFIDKVKGSSGQAIVPIEHQFPQLAPQVQDAKDSFTVAAQITAGVAAVFVLLGLIVSFGLPKDDVQTEAESKRDRDKAGAGA